MPGTYVYVDGFNLYNRAIKGAPHKWIDLSALADKVLGEKVAVVRYFTARVSAMPKNPQAPTRQQAYLRALGGDPRVRIHYGQFRPREKTGELLKPVQPKFTLGTIRTFEEKGSDVNLAAWALADAYEGRATKVVLLSNDSDLATPAQILKAKGTTVGVIVPKKGLKSNTIPADFYKTLRPGDLAASLLPDPAVDRRSARVEATYLVIAGKSERPPFGGRCTQGPKPLGEYALECIHGCDTVNKLVADPTVGTMAPFPEHPPRRQRAELGLQARALRAQLVSNPLAISPSRPSRAGGRFRNVAAQQHRGPGWIRTIEG